MIRIVLADDHPILRVGIRDLLDEQSDMEVVGEAANGDEAIRLVNTLKPDVLLLDMNMPGKSGVEVAREIVKRHRSLRILALSAYDDVAYVKGLMTCGAAGYVTKEQSPQIIIEAIRAVVQGEGRWFVPIDSVADEAPLLSAREKEVLQYMAQGHSNHEIASMLSITDNTVRNHVSKIYAKLDVRTWREAVAWAWKHGLIENP